MTANDNLSMLVAMESAAKRTEDVMAGASQTEGVILANQVTILAALAMLLGEVEPAHPKWELAGGDR